MKENMEALDIGDEVIVNYDDTYDLIRYKKFNGHRAIVIKYLPHEKPFEYKLRFTNEEVEEEYREDNGGLLFKREWLEKVGTNEELAKKYLEEIDENGDTDTSIEKPPVIDVPLLDLDKACKYLEANGRKGIRNRLFAYLGDKIEDGAVIEVKLIYTEQELERSIKISKDILLDLEKVKETWNISGDYVYFKVSGI